LTASGVFKEEAREEQWSQAGSQKRIIKLCDMGHGGN